MEKKSCKVIADYKSPFPEPLMLHKDDIVQVEEKESEWTGWIWCISKEGKQGWVPNNYLEIQGKNGKLIQDYDATELTAKTGEELIIENQESGWIWASNKEGNKGWIPKRNVAILK
ncbi:MAG: SH3 domain-containing protein [Candidatus Thorarchaeota archaeon]